MAVYKRGGTWWFKFTFHGTCIRESTNQSNKRVAEQIEAARKTGLAKAEVGIRDAPRVPILRVFIEQTYLPYVETQFAAKKTTLDYSRIQARHLIAFVPLSSAPIDSITPAMVSGLIEKHRAADYEVSSINRVLQVLRRVLHLAVEWGVIGRLPVKIALVPGETRRERVLSMDEESKYLQAARSIGEELLASYRKSLTGIRAVKRGETPTVPADPFMLADVATLLLDLALRPDEVYRARWDWIRDGSLHVPTGKTKNARRAIPLSTRVAAIIDMRRTEARPDWIFPADTQSGHMEQSTLKKQHAKACLLAKIQGVPFYTFRHTCLTRWATHLDPYTLAYFAGHSDFGTTRRYVHPNLDTARESMKAAREAQGGHKNGHSDKQAGLTEPGFLPVIN